VVTSVTQVDIEQMRDQVFFEGPERNRRLSRYWLLLLLSAVIATAGVVSDSTATVIGAMIIAPLMTPILGVVLGVVTADRANLLRCLQADRPPVRQPSGHDRIWVWTKEPGNAARSAPVTLAYNRCISGLISLIPAAIMACNPIGGEFPQDGPGDS
jgi:hypothetical protein